MEILPLWLAPNMVTLLGFLFIVGNVMLIEVYMPDLVGPVRRPLEELPIITTTLTGCHCRLLPGYTIVLR